MGLSVSLQVPVAHEENARVTAAALELYQFESVTSPYVVEEGEDIPDKTPVG